MLFRSLTIGRRSSSSVQFAQVVFKDFVFQNTSIPWTQAQINNLYYRREIPSGANVWYKFDNSVEDSTGNGNTGTLTGGTYTTNVPSQFTARSLAGSRFLVRNMGKSLFCKGSFGNPRVRLTDESINQINTTSSYSFACFAKLFYKSIAGAAPGNDNHTFVALDFDFGTNKGYVIQFTNNFRFQIFYGNLSANSVITSIPIWDKWNHFAFTISGTSLRVYINGSLIDTVTISRVANAGLTRKKLFAEDSSGACRGLYGFVDDIYIKKDYVLSQQEIRDMCFRNKYPTADVLFRCNDTSGLVTDSSGNSNNGTIEDTNYCLRNQSDVFITSRSSV